jgi:hypothetical protein
MTIIAMIILTMTTITKILSLMINFIVLVMFINLVLTYSIIIKVTWHPINAKTYFIVISMI